MNLLVAPPALALVAPAALAARLDDPRTVVVGVSSGTHAGGHPAQIPGAYVFDWKTLLWDARQREFPTLQALHARLAAAGVAVADPQWVFYGEPVQYGFYARWVWLNAGLAAGRAGVLDGGLRAWRDAGLPLQPARAQAPTSGAEGFAAPVSPPYPGAGALRIRRDELLRRLEIGDVPLILDARSPEDYRGERVSPASSDFDHGAERGGHIPGAHLLPFADLVDGAGRLRPAQAVARRLAALGVGPDHEVVVYCRLGHRSTLLYFVLTELLGYARVRVYDGSWTEWGSLVNAPIER